ncbi:non-ribosomal peptide synthetase, partial [Paraburkholderia sp. Ac-20340]|uniref:phosphopantetheine-binding protein n=1 Tax=Paraburkholderia sp. Ac-20340 TaxID=2703888 RepID=UPI00197E67F2
PRDELEQAIATVWQDVLAAPALSVHDNFHALGGHSLLAVQIAARLTRVLAQPVALAAVLAHGTVARLAQHLRDNAAEQAAAAQQQEAAADDRDVMKRLLAELD